MKQKGKLYLIPSPLGAEGAYCIPPYVVDRIHQLEVFIAERAKTARHFIKSTGIKRPLQELEFFELNKFTQPAEKKNFLAAAELGKDIGLLSEAGCPGVADPGADIVQLAHAKGIEVVPMVGPSSILLALMASGMSGQNFAFKGYLPAKKPELGKALKAAEQIAYKFKQTQLFIETPYRNNSFLEMALSNLRPATQLCVAAELTLPQQYIRKASVAAWKKEKLPDLHKRPAIFLIAAPE